MKKYNHPTDDFFRDALKDHQMIPSDAARKAFLKDAIGLPPGRKNGKGGLILLSAIIALVGMGILFWATTDHQRSVSDFGAKKGHNAVVPTPNIKNTGNPNSKPASTGALQHIPESVGAENIQPLQPERANNIQPLQTERAENTQPLQTERAENIQPQPVQNQIVADKNQPTPMQVFPEVAAINIHSATTGSGAPLEGNPSPPSSINNQTITSPPGMRIDSAPVMARKDSLEIPSVVKTGKVRESQRKEGKIKPGIGVYYTPEWMFGTIEGTKFVNNFGLEGTFHFGKFSIRTGAGLSVSKGTNELTIGYNDFLGSYNKLDSIEFTWSSPLKEYIPKYFMSNKDVWDSLMKLDHAMVVKRNTYLQIPLIIGYDFWQTDNISIGFRVGPMMSILLVSKQLSAAYDPGTKRIVSINDISPGQVSLNWQAIAGLSASFRLTKELQFEVEPSVRYYFNSVYEKPEPSWKPWSVGIRAAFTIKL